ncbi:MAG: TagK domain-containing protein, partial [Pyrinomonadaceae bacterium]
MNEIGSGFAQRSAVYDDPAAWAGELKPGCVLPEDPFAILKAGTGTAATGKTPAGPAAENDILAQLIAESEAVLRNPDHVGAHASPGDAVQSSPATTRAEPGSLHALAAQAGPGSLRDMVAGELTIEALIGPPGELDALQSLVLPARQDVLRLFAGDIPPAQGSEIATPLVQREHHLLSMNSAYRAAQAAIPQAADET